MDIQANIFLVTSQCQLQFWGTEVGFASKSGTPGDRKKVGNKKKRGKKKIRPYISCTRVRVFDFLPSDSKFRMPYCTYIS